MKVIFIDPLGTLETAHNQDILKNKRLFKRLKKIVNATGAKIVLTSCYNHSIKQYKHHAVKEAFNKYNLEIYDYTSVTGIEKAVDIQEWLNKNFDVTNIVIIDNNFHHNFSNDSCSIYPIFNLFFEQYHRIRHSESENFYL